MLKLTIIFFTMLFVYGGCNMTEAVSTSGDTSAVEQRIKEHAQKNFSIPADKINFTKAGFESEVSGVQEFFISEEGRSHGSSYTYFLYKDNLYCSGIDEDFGRFLKDYDFLKKPELDRKWFLYVLRKLNDFGDQIFILENRINKPGDNLKPFLSKISVPKFEKTANSGAKLTLFTQSPRTVPVRMHEITVSSDYKVTFENKIIEP